MPYYVSLGDSYASGYEAGVGNTDNGFAYQVVDEAAAPPPHPLVLVNFGCGGATTTSLLEAEGLLAPRPRTGGRAVRRADASGGRRDAFIRTTPARSA